MKQNRQQEPEAFEKRDKSLHCKLTESEYKAFSKKAALLGASITCRLMVLAFTRGDITVSVTVKNGGGS